jgi:hypothetical protein
MRPAIRLVLLLFLGAGLGLGCGAKATGPVQTNLPSAAERSRLPQRPKADGGKPKPAGKPVP